MHFVNWEKDYCETRISVRELAEHHKHRCIINFVLKKRQHMEIKDLKGTLPKLPISTRHLETFNEPLRICILHLADYSFNTARSETQWKTHGPYSHCDLFSNPWIHNLLPLENHLCIWWNKEGTKYFKITSNFFSMKIIYWIPTLCKALQPAWALWSRLPKSFYTVIFVQTPRMQILYL